MNRDDFTKRWSLEELERIDPDLYEAVLDQENMLAEHAAAMARGWQAANRRMEEAEIAKALAAFPGSKVIAVRPKGDETPDVAK